jgi:putative pyruvate formate lyase activating enzyme
VDVYLPDFKYSDNKLAEKLSHTPNYVETAISSIAEMLFQVGKPKFGDDGMIQKGVIVRHLILPAHTRQSIAALELLKRTFGDEILVSLMCQYVPWGEAKRHPKLGRKITQREYDKVKAALFQNNIDGFTQDLSAASTEYIPDWDFEE